MIRRMLPTFVVLLFASQVAISQAAPRPVLVEILKPVKEAELSGQVEVVAKVTFPTGGKTLPVVCAGLGGDWVTLTKNDTENVWTGVLDSTMVPNGNRELRVFAGVPRGRAAVKVRVRNPLKLFFADLHSHTSYSDGTLTPAVAHRYARDDAKLDAFSLTDHLEQVDDDEWLDTRDVAWDSNEDGRFVVIPGLEWTKKWGHLNIFDPKKRSWPKKADNIYEVLAAAKVVAKFNHPGDGTKSHGGLEYSEIGDQALQMMEVRGDEEQKAYIRALNQGWHIAPDGSDDTHAPNWGNNGTWTGILAPGLSKVCVWDAMQKRHLYSTRDRNCSLTFEVNGATMGDIIEKDVSNVEACIRVEDPDESDAIAKIELFEDGKVVETDEPTAARREWKTGRSPKPGKHYYFVKVTQADGNAIWSAPVWVTVSRN